jgi:hypothetical protein
MEELAAAGASTDWTFGTGANSARIATMQKLQFILNKDLRPVRSSREQIALAIDRHYGQ